MSDPTFNPINPAVDGFVLYQPVTLEEGQALYPEQYSPDVQATVEERLTTIIFQLNRAATMLRAFKFAQMAPLIGGLNDDINGFRVNRGATEPDTETAQFGDIWLQPDAENPGARIPRVFNGIGFVEGLYAVDAILIPIKARLQALEAQGIDGFTELIDDLRAEILGDPPADRNTLEKLSDAVDTAIAAASAAASASIPLSQKGAASGVAELDGSGKIPASQLPSYVDDVIEAANFAALPGTGETGKIYVTLSDNRVYRWSGSAYIEIVGSPGSTDAVPEGATNKYFTDARAQAALTSLLAGKQATITGTKGQLVGFNDSSAAVAVPAHVKYAPWFFATDGVTPVTSQLQALLDGGGHIILGPGTYVSGPLTVPAGTKITSVGNRQTILKQQTSSGTFISMAANTSIEGIIVDGSYTTQSYAGGYTAGHRGVSCVGGSGADRDNWRVEDCEVRNFGETGIYGQWLTNTNILENWVHRCGYAGIMLLSPLDPVIQGNWVENIFPGPSGNENAYGITCTSSSGHRVPKGCKILGNTVKDVPTWEGIDIHFGTDSRIEGNIVTGCAQGIAYENSIAASPGANISIVNNTVIGWAGATTTRDGQTMEKTAGIVATGGAANEFGDGLEITGNLVHLMGDTRPGGAAAIYARGWRKYNISLNTVRDSYRAAIGLGSSGTAGMEDGTVSLNIIAGVSAHNGVARGIDADGQVDGEASGNIITGVASTGQPIFQASGSKKLRIARPRLEAALNLYVRSDGSDTNSGLFDSAAAAFATAARAMAEAAKYDTNGFDIVINEKRSTITESVQFPAVFGGGRIVYLGNTSSPSSHVISVTGASAVRAENKYGRYAVQGFRIQTSTSGSGIKAVGKGVVLEHGNNEFGACADHHIDVDRATLIRLNDYSITGQAATHINALHSADVDNRNFTTTITGTLNFGTAFIRALRNSYVGMHGGTINTSGATVTGKRYDAQQGSVIFTNGGGANYLPGDSAGTTDSGGVYA
jgi:hypothetical protein